MSSVSKPPFLITYWNPFENNSPGLIDSYINYTRDISLHEYNADIVGSYIYYLIKSQSSPRTV